MSRTFVKPGEAPTKPLPGENERADRLIRGGELPLSQPEPPAMEPAPPFQLTTTNLGKDLPKSFLLRLNPGQAQLLELAYAQLPYKTRQAMLEDVLFTELRRRLGTI